MRDNPVPLQTDTMWLYTQLPGRENALWRRGLWMLERGEVGAGAGPPGGRGGRTDECRGHGPLDAGAAGAGPVANSGACYPLADPVRAGSGGGVEGAHPGVDEAPGPERALVRT